MARRPTPPPGRPAPARPIASSGIAGQASWPARPRVPPAAGTLAAAAAVLPPSRHRLSRGAVRIIPGGGTAGDAPRQAGTGGRPHRLGVPAARVSGWPPASSRAAPTASTVRGTSLVTVTADSPLGARVTVTSLTPR